MRSVLAIALLCIASPALASNWAPFFDCGQGENVRHYSYDQSSIQRRGDFLLVKIAGDYSGLRDSRAQKVRMVFAIDCNGRTYHQERRVEYRANGRVIARYSSPTPPMTISSPGIGQNLFERVCA
jgi:hypothetical protein